MSWIKRNLFFFIGSIVALVLMGLAGWSSYAKWQLNNKILADLKANFEELRGLTTRNPHPGDGKINNIQNAKDQQLQYSNYMARTRVYFEPIERLPSSEDAPKLTDRDLTTALSKTIDQLQKQATVASVTVSSNYYFSFEALRGKVSFDPKGLLPLATQLGEVKAICDVLFQAKVNALENIRRERVASEDSLGGLQTD
ncbi:MAG TPA: Amuc_1100 family pilus-like protein, partial [Verrucomicrobiae bacterium]